MTKRLSLAVLVAALLSIHITAQPRYSFEQLTISTTAVGITKSVLAGMAGCSVDLEGDDVRYRYDGTAPTTTVGAKAANGSSIVMTTIQAAQNLQMIRDNATDVTGWVQCWSNP